MVTVGSPLYISPEMVEKTISVPENDLWALGVIIFEMSVGRSPFIDPIPYKVSQKIKARDFQIPNDLDEHTADVIDKLI